MSHEQAIAEAATYLHGRGFDILSREWRIRSTAADHLCIVARDGAQIVVVSVTEGSAADITPLAYERINWLLGWWVIQFRERRTRFRVDQISVQLQHGGYVLEHARGVTPRV